MKRCPFCGQDSAATAHLFIADADDKQNGKTDPRILCLTCGAIGPETIGRLGQERYRSAEELWDTRIP